MKPLGVPSDATEKLKERKKLEKEKQEQMEKMEKQKEEKEMRDQRLQQTDGMQGHAQLRESQHMMGAMGGNEQYQPEMYNATGFYMAPSFLPIHFAPPVQPTDAPEVASKLQERWQNIGQEYKLLA